MRGDLEMEKQYKVDLFIEGSIHYIVEAKNKNDAERIAKELFFDENPDIIKERLNAVTNTVEDY